MREGQTCLTFLHPLYRDGYFMFWSLFDNASEYFYLCVFEEEVYHWLLWTWRQTNG